jgi:biopolymer transport protein ExbB/TolQ
MSSRTVTIVLATAAILFVAIIAMHGSNVHRRLAKWLPAIHGSAAR